MSELQSKFLVEHKELTRRFFLGKGAIGIAALSQLNRIAAAERPAPLQTKIDALEPWLTSQDDFNDVSRGNPKPHTLSEDERKQVGLTRDTWTLDVVSDTENKARVRKPFSAEDGNSFTFADLMKLAERNAVRFPKIMTCLNLGCPLGNGIWEGVPLREVIWLTEPVENLRRISYYGYHNDDPKQMFRSSLPIGRVLEDPFGLPPVILCYKLNGQWLSPERGGPVRIVVPEAYGFKNIKWLQHISLSNDWKSNDTYGEKNNDVDSPLKTFCETLNVPVKHPAMQPLPVTGYAQVGISGLKKVQVWIQKEGDDRDYGKYFADAPWQDAEVLGPPKEWGGDLPNGMLPEQTIGFEPNWRVPTEWPIRLSKAHWAVLLPGLPAGQHTLRCRTIDDNGTAQPMPRPFKKSGRAKIDQVAISIG